MLLFGKIFFMSSGGNIGLTNEADVKEKDRMTGIRDNMKSSLSSLNLTISL